MDYPLTPANWLCRFFDHFLRSYTDRDGVDRQTCSLCGLTRPPFRKLAQMPPFGYLPDDQQPPGAV